MNRQYQSWFSVLVISAALCLPPLAHGEEAGATSTASNMNEMKFGPVPGMPTCLSGVVESGNPMKGAGIILAKLGPGCSIPWHWHTAGEYVMVAKGAGRIDMKDAKSKELRSGGFALLPSRHVHQFRCTNSCALFIYTDAAFDIHYVNAKGEDIPPDDALKAVMEKAAKG